MSKRSPPVSCIPHPSSFIPFKCSRHAVNLKHERDVGDLAALLLTQQVEEYGGGGAVAVPDVARRHALAQMEARGLGRRRAVEDLHFVFGGEVFRVHLFTRAPCDRLLVLLRQRVAPVEEQFAYATLVGRLKDFEAVSASLLQLLALDFRELRQVSHSPLVL